MSADLAHPPPLTAEVSAKEQAISIALVGMPGCGKTTVGRHLARKLGLRFLDSDALIEELLGTSIRSFFEREGEAKFRDIETEVLEETTKRSGIVLSTGGGAVLRTQNRQYLHGRSTVIYLRATPEDLFRRIGKDSKRPLLQVADPLGKLRELFNQRDALYQASAHYIIDTGRPSVSQLVNKILMQIDLHSEPL